MEKSIKLVGQLNIVPQLEGILNNEPQLIGSLNNTNGLYSGLVDKPQINGVTLEGNKTSQELKILEDQTYVFTQARASAVWNVNHNLNKFPAVVVVDSANSIVVGEITYIDFNNITVSFSGAFSGKCYCN